MVAVTLCTKLSIYKLSIYSDEVWHRGATALCLGLERPVPCGLQLDQRDSEVGAGVVEQA